MQQCHVCGRTLSESAIQLGECPSCGSPVTAAPAATETLTPTVKNTAPQTPAVQTPAATPPAANEPAAQKEESTTSATAASSGVHTAPQYPETQGSAPAYPGGMVYPTVPQVPQTQPQTPTTAMPVAGETPASTQPAAAPQSYAPAPTQAQAPTSVAAAPQKSNSGLVIGLISAIVVIVLLVAGVGLFALGKNGQGPLASLGPTATPTLTPTPTFTPTPTATPVPTVPAPASGFATFTAADGSYGFNYPSTFLTSTQSTNGVNVSLATDGTNIFGALNAGVTLTPAELPTLASSFFSSFSKASVTVSPTTQTITTGTNSWTEDDATFTFQGKPYKGAFYLPISSASSSANVVVFAAAPAASYTSEYTSAFSISLASFTFLK